MSYIVRHSFQPLRSTMTLRAIIIFALLALAYAEDQEHEEELIESNGLSTLQFPGELTFSDGFLRTVSVAGALVTGVAGLAAILSFLLPTLGFRTCVIFGTCDDDPVTAYNPATNSVYDQQGYNNYHQYAGGFRKRSLEYVGPILKALSSAYEKYGPPAQHRRATVKAAEVKSK